MATRVRSYCKVNVGLGVGGPRADGFHGLRTLYLTLGLHDLVTVSARRTGSGRAGETVIRLHSNDGRVPCDGRNTAWKMVERALAAAGVHADVSIYINKRLPVQGGMGAGSANAAAALVGLERELRLGLSLEVALRLAAEVGSDVPLFLLGGSVLGEDRGQAVRAVRDVTLGGETEIACCVALPEVGVSTPAAFRDWDRRWAAGPDLHNSAVRDTLVELSRIYASVLPHADGVTSMYGASGIFPDTRFVPDGTGGLEKQQGLLHEQLHGSSTGLRATADESGFEDDLAGNTLLALVRTGMENDFETVVFPKHPPLRDIKRYLKGDPGSPDEAVYAALSGSGSALFGLYRTMADAERAQQRCQQHGVKAVLTKTMPRPLYWNEMFAE